MSFHKNLLIAVSSAFLLAGCARMIWVKPGATQGQFEQVKAACMIEAAQQVPQDNRTVLVSEAHTTRTSQCKDKKGCITTSSYSPAQYGVVDNNQDLRTQVFRACLFRNGWQEIEDKD